MTSGSASILAWLAIADRITPLVAVSVSLRRARRPVLLCLERIVYEWLHPPSRSVLSNGSSRFLRTSPYPARGPAREARRVALRISLVLAQEASLASLPTFLLSSMRLRAKPRRGFVSEGLFPCAHLRKRRRRFRRSWPSPSRSSASSSRALPSSVSCRRSIASLSGRGSADFARGAT